MVVTLAPLATMQALHLQYSWIIMFVAVICIFTGFALTQRRLLALIDRVRHSESRLEESGERFLLAKAERSSAPGLAFRRHAGGLAVWWEARLASVRHGSATSITEQTARPLPDQGLDKPS